MEETHGFNGLNSDSRQTNPEGCIAIPLVAVYDDQRDSEEFKVM